MDKIIEFFQQLTPEKVLNLLQKWYVIVFISCFLVILIFFIITCCKNTKKQKKMMLQKNLSIVRLFAIHYEDNYVYSIDKFNFKNQRKESLEWFYNSFTPQDKLRLVVWIKELKKENNKVPKHLELHVQVKGVKQPIFCVISVSSVNYEQKVIHMESRLFPNIKRINKKNHFSKNNILHAKELPELLSAHNSSIKNIFLIRLYSTNELDAEDSRINHLVMTLIMSRLVRYCSDVRQIISLNANEIVIIDFKMASKNEAFAFSHTISNEISKVLFLSSEDEEFNYKIGIVQRKDCSVNLAEEIKLAREMSIYAESAGNDTNSIIYDENLSYQNHNQEAIIKDIKNKMDRRQFSCRYTPILNTYDGSIFGYNCELFAQKALVGSISDMQDYASHNNFLTDLNRILYIETNKVFNYGNSLNRFVYTTMDLKPSQYLSFIDIYTHSEAPKHVKTIFIIEDNDLIEDQQKGLSIIKELKKYDMSLGLKLTSTQLELNPDIMKSFDYFFLYEETFSNVVDSQQQILYGDMISRLSFYSAQIISLNISSWTLIEFACKSGIKHVSSSLFGTSIKELPSVDIKKTNKLINVGKHY
jgi:uncharacterized protein YutD